MKENIWSIKWDNFVIEFLDEIKTEFENTLACLLGTQMVSNHTKYRWKVLAGTDNRLEPCWVHIIYTLYCPWISPYVTDEANATIYFWLKSRHTRITKWTKIGASLTFSPSLHSLFRRTAAREFFIAVSTFCN